MKKRFLPLLFLPSLLGIGSCSGGSSSNVTYQVTLGDNDSCVVYRVNATTDVEARYAGGYTLRQYSDSVFELSSGERKAAYSNSRYGYKIIVSSS